MSDGLLSTAQPRADQARRAVLREQADARPAPSALDTAGAGVNTAFDTIEVTQERRLDRAYGDVVRALEERGVDKSELRSWRFWLPQLPFVENRVWDDDAIWSAIEKQRQADPAAFKEIGTREEFERRALTRNGNRARDLETMSRGSGLAAFAGGALGSMADPVNIATLPFGGVGKTIGMKVLTEGLAQGVVTGVQTPQIAAAHHAMGEEYGLREAGADIAMGFAGGVAVRGGIELAPKIDAAGYRALAPLRERMPGGTVSERDMARAFSRSVPEELRTPAQSAALHVITRAEEIDAASPFRQTHAGLDEHAAKLAEAMEALETAGERVQAPAATLTPPTPVSRASGAPAGTGGRLHGGIVSHLQSAGIPASIARGIAAGIEAESRSSHTIVNPTSGAFGIGQWLGPRKKELFRRYGPNPSLAQQLDFLVWELRGGDHGGKSVLGAGDEAEALRRYIVDFMRPAKGAETSGDLQRGMAALGRGQEAVPVEGAAPPVAGADDGALDAALAAEEADISARRATLEGPQVEGAADDLEAATADIPLLDSEKLTAGLVDVLRPIVRETGGRSLNRVEELAGDLGVSEQDLRAALDRMVGTGELGVTKSGTYRRKGVASGGDDDLVRFVARNGGLSYDGLSALGRERGTSLGHDLRNTGNLDRFVPGIGPLLRPGGKGLDEMGELLHEQGFFGPPETTARPTEREVIDTLDELLRSGNKRYVGGGEAESGLPMQRGVRPKGDPFQSDEHYDMARAEYDEAARKLLGRDLDESEFLEAYLAAAQLPAFDRRPREDYLAQQIVDMANRRLDEALDDAFLEVEDDLYELDSFTPDDAAGREGAARGDGSGRQAADAGDQGESSGGGEAGPRAGEQAQLDGAARDAAEAEGALGPDLPESKTDAARFDADDGDGVRAIAESDWHDIRAGVERESTVDLPGGDTRGQGVQYHGARGELPDLTEGYYNPDNIYGGHETFYTTDATDIAGGYQRKRAAGMIYRADEVSPVNTFDMEARLPAAEVAALFGIRDWDNAVGFPASAIEEAADSAGTVNLREAMDEIRAQSRAEEYSKDEVQEIFDGAIYNLQQQGFGAMRHVGGLQTGREPHNVTIYFDAKDQLRLTPAKRGEAPKSDKGEAVDPAIAERQREEARLAAEAPLRGANKTGQDQDGTMGLGLFDAADQPKFDLEDGKGPRTAAEIDAEIAADKAALEAMRSCLK